MVGVEIDMVVCDSVKALELYERVFGAERVEVTAYENGLNEAVFTIFETRFHLLTKTLSISFSPRKTVSANRCG